MPKLSRLNVISYCLFIILSCNSQNDEDKSSTTLNSKQKSSSSTLEPTRKRVFRALIFQGSTAQELPSFTKKVTNDTTSIDQFLTSKGYTNLSRLGKGKQGEVYSAEKSDNQLVVIKSISVDDDSTQAKKEYNILKTIDHPKVIKAINLEGKFMTLEHVTGMDLEKFIKSNKCDYKDIKLAFYIGIQLLEVLIDLHENYSIFHKDINLRNVMLTGDNEVKLIDFGMAEEINKTTDLEKYTRELETELSHFKYAMIELITNGEEWSNEKRKEKDFFESLQEITSEQEVLKQMKEYNKNHI